MQESPDSAQARGNQPVPAAIYVLPAEAVDAKEHFTLARAIALLLALRYWLIAGFIIGGLGGFGATLLMKPAYRAETLLSPSKLDSAGTALSGLTSQLGGLASLTGITLPTVGRTKAESLAVLTSQGFLSRFVEGHGLLPILFSKRWDANTKRWNVERPELIPTLSDAVDLLRKKVIFIKDDRRTGLVTVAVEWRDRELASSWANLLVNDLNSEMRERAIDEANRSIEYLDRELQKASVLELREAIFRLTENEIKTAMVANVKQQFAFQVLDSAVAPDPDKYVRPSVLINMLLGMVTGILAAIVIGRRWPKWHSRVAARA